MAEQFNFSNNLQQAPPPVAAPNPFVTDQQFANAQLTTAEADQAKLKNQMAQIDLNQRQASIAAMQRIMTANSVNTPAPQGTPQTNPDGTPVLGPDGQPVMSAPKADTNHAGNATLGGADFIDQYTNELQKSGMFTPNELLGVKKAYVDNINEMRKTAATADDEIAKAQEQQQTAAKAAQEHLGSTLLPVQQAMDKGDRATANALYGASLHHMGELAVNAAQVKKGAPLTQQEQQAVLSQALTPWLGQNGAGIDDPSVQARLRATVGSSPAGQEYNKTQSTLKLQAQETETSAANAVKAKIEGAVSEAKLPLEAGEHLSKNVTNAQQAAGIVRLAQQARDVDDLVDQVRSTYGSDTKKLQNVVVSSMSPKMKQLIQTIMPNYLTGASDQRIDLQRIIQTANQKFAILDAAVSANDQVKGSLGSDERAKMAREQSGELHLDDKNATWNNNMKLRKYYTELAEETARGFNQAANNDTKMVIKGVNKGFNGPNGAPGFDEKDYLVPAAPKRGAGAPNPLTNEPPKEHTPSNPQTVKLGMTKDAFTKAFNAAGNNPTRLEEAWTDYQKAHK